MCPEEVTVDFFGGDESDSVSVDDISSVSDVSESDVADGGTAPVEPEPDPEPIAEPEPDYKLELERERKDKSRMAYELREQKRQMEFMQQQLREQQEKEYRQNMQTELQRDLASIEHLKDYDVDTYLKERDRIYNSHTNKQVENERKLSSMNAKAEESNSRMIQVGQALHRDFPDIQDQNSELFLESQKAIQARYSGENAAYLSQNPQVMYDIVESVSAKLQLKALGKQKADNERSSRVASQGAVRDAQKPSGAASLTKEQREFCKANGFKEEDYARFVQKGRR